MAEGMDPFLEQALQRMIDESGGRLFIRSGFRTRAEQTQLWNDAVATYGEAEAPNWAARPGSSNHERGLAADIGWADEAAKQWMHANAWRFGLHFPMDWEPWHIEPIGVSNGQFQGQDFDPGAYTVPPTGQMGVGDPQALFTLEGQLQNLASIVANPGEDQGLGPSVELNERNPRRGRLFGRNR